MDTSIARMKKRIAALEDLDIDGFVFTSPFYSAANRAQMSDFAQDYNSPVTETAIANVREELIRIGELKG